MTVDRIGQKLDRERQLAALKRDGAPGWITVKAYCQHYGIDRSTLRKWVGHGVVTSYRVGRCVRIKHEPPKELRAHDVATC